MNDQPKANKRDLPQGIEIVEMFLVQGVAEPFKKMEAAIRHLSMKDVRDLIDEYLCEKYAVLGDDGAGSRGRTRDFNSLLAWEEWKLGPDDPPISQEEIDAASSHSLGEGK